ncbi:sulfatase-like hydrolase/transferase [Flaviaesturariibacter terrae]
MRRLARSPIYLLLLPAFFALHGYVQNYGLLPGGEALRLLLVYGLLAGLLAGLAWLLLRNSSKAALLAFVLLGVELFFGSVQDVLRNRLPVLASWPLIITGLLVLLLLVVWRLRTKALSPKWALYLNLLLIVFLLADGGLWLQKHRMRAAEADARHWTRVPASGPRPDVFLVIADEYASGRALHDLLGFDNGPFLDSLRRLGFVVNDESLSNYNYTEYSTASLLNSAYFPAASRTNATDVGRCFSWIRDNETLRFFRGQGYSLHNHSIFDFDGLPSSAPRTWNEQWRNILRQQTLSARLAAGFFPSAETQASYQAVNDSLLRHTRELLARPATAPRFVYTHLLIPHPPYYADAQGQPQPEALANDRSNGAAYVAFLQYGNRLYLDLVHRILAQTKRPTVILLLGDHGFRGSAKAVPQHYYFRNLYAVYTSPGLVTHWNERAGFVNSFRVLLNSCFGQKLPLLPDRRQFIGEQAP